MFYVLCCKTNYFLEKVQHLNMTLTFGFSLQFSDICFGRLWSI